jgi:hypothetical protein
MLAQQFQKLQPGKIDVMVLAARHQIGLHRVRHAAILRFCRTLYLLMVFVYVDSAAPLLLRSGKYLQRRAKFRREEQNQ